MNLALTRTQPTPVIRAAPVLFPFFAVALGLGLWLSSGSSEWMPIIMAALLIALGAWAIPLGSSVLVMVALIPFQIYLIVPGSSLSLRVAALFAIALALRAVTLRRNSFWLRWRIWAVPIGLFIVSAIVGAWGASNRYLALKGLYDWLPFLASFFVMIQASPDARRLRQICAAIVLGGTVEASLGLAQYILGLDATVRLLRIPLAQALYQPSLLQERLIDLSFNWVNGDRIVPFGTFINAIDMAVYLAAVLSLALAFFLTRSSESATPARCEMPSRVGLGLASIVQSIALVLTLKGSGLLALVGGVAAIALCSARRFSNRILPILGLAVVGVAFAVAFSDPLTERVTFLVERELGLAGTIGRLAIWNQLLSRLGERPWFGFGLNHASLIAEPTRTLSGGALAFISTSPESAPVAVLVETGLVGLFALCLLFGIALVRAYHATGDTRTRHVAIGVFAGIIALLFGNLTVSGLTTDQNGMLLGVLLGIAGGAWNRQ